MPILLMAIGALVLAASSLRPVRMRRHVSAAIHSIAFIIAISGALLFAQHAIR